LHSKISSTLKAKFYLAAIILFYSTISLSQPLKTDGLYNLDVINSKLLIDMIDTSTQMGKNMLALYNKFGQVGFSGYLQPQFQYSLTKGNPNSYQGGDWGKAVDNRFRLRRGRLRADFSHYTNTGKPSVYFILQFDGTERGVNIRDLWGRYYENKWELFHVSAGVMARPFGHELLLSSTFREAPERGRMSQILLQTERDLGVMFSFNPRKANASLKWLSIDLGIYNGQGLTGPAEYDSRKDFVFRIASKKQTLKKLGGLKISGGLSVLYGGITNQSMQYYTMKNVNNSWQMRTDSLQENIGKNGNRTYFSGDVQLVIPNAQGQTEFRAEYVRGQQTGTLQSSVTPGSYPTENNNPAPLATRNFDGAYFYFLQHLGSWKHQLILKYDWYDPNTKVSGKAIDAAKGLTPADIKYNTIGGGYMYYVNKHMKITLWYEHPINEKTSLINYTNDIKDGIFTCRTQFSF
jgi:hypothetical protein